MESKGLKNAKFNSKMDGMKTHAKKIHPKRIHPIWRLIKLERKRRNSNLGKCT